MLTKYGITKSDVDFKVVPCGDLKFALVDTEDYNRIAAYRWLAIRPRGCCYAIRKASSGNQKFYVAMHRQIMHCPRSKIVHHINGHTLDNRKANLHVMSKNEHHHLHKFD